MTFSKAEACAILHISDSTFTRRLKAGRYKGTRTGEGQYAPLSFTYEGLGLQEPEPEPPPAVVAVKALPAPAPAVETVPDICTPDAFNPQEFRDSFGHKIAGNEKHVLFESQPPRSQFETDGHMPAGIRKPFSGDAENVVDSDAYKDMTRTPGTPTIAERMAAMSREGRRSLSAQERKGFVDRAAVDAAFRQGFSR